MMAENNMTCLDYLHSLSPSIRGIIQVGAHHGEEHQLWESWGIANKAYFEPVPENFKVMVEKLSGPLMFPLALGNEIKKVEMFTETVNGGQSCSVLAPAKHKEILPWIEFTGKVEVIMTRLDDVGLDRKLYDFLYVDAQGYDLEVLKGGAETLKGINYVIAEVNRDEVYEGCSKLDEIVEFLEARGIMLRHVDWHGGAFGDGCFIRDGY